MLAIAEARLQGENLDAALWNGRNDKARSNASLLALFV